ncbi:protein shuttle craft-like [Macrobrachium nipponense]|uniref:protein shuttle craft-like n=1 Tax=Macrobrachium nipponense TaxID=159736 RepID=UPI0030C855C5
MRNLNIGIGSESSNTPPQVEESTSAARMRGVSRKRPGRARNGGWGQQRDCIEEKQGKEWKNRQVKTECQDEQQLSKATKPVKERNGASNKQWSNVNSESKTTSEVTPISRSEGLIEQLSRGLYECMVCCDRIKQPQAIWSCPGCYNCFHLGCIKKWAKTSAGDGGWRCPACQGFTAKVPNTYLCFCGKVREPEWNHRETPHSCGEICGRKRKIEWCKHKCNILCHPGPCPPCSAFIRRSCPCGTETREVRCSMTESFLCGNPCNKDLNCGGHKCPTKCHVGPCQECAEIVKQSCYCGKEDREVPCTAESFEILKYECGKECSRILECGNHKCSSNCHAGDCQRCEKAIDVVLRCPCDKVPLEKIYERDGVIPRKSCSDPVPTCGQICSRKLKCGVPGSYHECQAMCHEGPCPPCPLSTPVKCRCGSLDQEVSCSELTTKADEVRCKRACKKMRECGRHKCSTRCCIDIDHICTLICGRTLTCGLHKCEDTCHRGNCRRCQETSFEELTCHCGAQVTFPPIPCGTKPPECNNPCSRPMPCGHTPTHNCHPEDNCPPCTILVDKPCFGNHKTMKSTPCYLKALSCGSVCNKPLSCGQHNCLLVCHEQPCVAPGSSCPQKCLKSRDSCGHPCGSACHTGPCPDVTCKEMVIITCGCGHRTSMLKCSENDREYRAMTTSLLASQMRNMNSGCSVDISEIFTATARPDKLKRLTCNEDCKTLERNRRLAMALQIENPETRETLGNSSNLYSDFMKEEARKDPSLAKMVHDTLTELVMKAKESKQKSRSHSFAPMNRDKRRFIHEYCEHFGCQSQAYDEEPKKNVVATAVKGTCYLPPISVLTQLQREQGQKKVPGPVWSRKAVTS